MNLLLSALWSATVTGLSLRSKVPDFGCTDRNNGPCISPNMIGAPDKLNPSTISTSMNQHGFVIANAVEGDDGRDGDPGRPRGEDDDDPAARYMIVAPVLEDPPPLPGLVHCERIEECTTTTTTIPPGA